MKRLVVIAGASEAAYSKLSERKDDFVRPDETLVPACIGMNSNLTGQQLAERAGTRIFDSLIFRPDYRYTDATVTTLLFSIPSEVAIPFKQWMAFTYTVEIQFDARLVKVSNSQAIELVRACQASLSHSRRALSAIRDEVQQRDSQTPLLLPLRNFRFAMLGDFILSLPHTLQQGEDHHKRLKTEISRLMNSLTVDKEARSTVFIDDRNVHFRAPGKAGPRHGSPSLASPHIKLCFLSGHFRLGAAFHCRFHYDCTRNGGQKLEGTFFDCHGGWAKWIGNPHLNISPNDFVRA